MLTVSVVAAAYSLMWSEAAAGSLTCYRAALRSWSCLQALIAGTDCRGGRAMRAGTRAGTGTARAGSV